MPRFALVHALFESLQATYCRRSAKSSLFHLGGTGADTSEHAAEDWYKVRGVQSEGGTAFLNTFVFSITWSLYVQLFSVHRFCNSKPSAMHNIPSKSFSENRSSPNRLPMIAVKRIVEIWHRGCTWVSSSFCCEVAAK